MLWLCCGRSGPATPSSLFPEPGPPAGSRSPWSNRISTSGTSNRMIGLVCEHVPEALERERQHRLFRALGGHAEDERGRPPQLVPAVDDIDRDAERPEGRSYLSDRLGRALQIDDKDTTG